MSEHVPNESFVRSLTGCQQSLFSYILSLLPNPDDARDVLQNTNVVMWRKASQFREGTNFIAWACQVARLEVLAHRRDTARDRHVFDDDLVGQLASDAEERAVDPDRRTQAFEHCFRELTEHQRELIHERYSPGGSVQAMAKERDRSPGAISVAVSRIRKTLKKCIERQLLREDQQ